MPDDDLAGVVDAIPVGVFAVGSDGRMTFWNATAARLTGWTREEVVGAATQGDGGPDAATMSRILDELRAGRPFSGRLPGDSTGTLYFRAVPAPGDTIVGVIQGVAETGAADEAFALLDALWENAPVGLAYFDTQLRYRRVNEAVLAMSGGSSDDRIGRTIAEVHGPTGEEIAEIVREVLAGAEPRVDVAVGGRLWHGRGSHQDWRMYAYPVRDGRGTVVGVGLVVLDITAVERSRRELAEVAVERELALNRYQSLVEAASAAVWTRRADGSARDDAPGLRAITGQTRPSYLGLGFLDVVHPADRDRIAQGWQAAVTSSAPAVFTADYRLRTQAAGYRWFRTRAVPVTAGGAVVEWVGTESDVHEAVRVLARADVLAAATHAMAPQLDPEGEFAAIADSTVPALADLCRVYIVDPAATPARTDRVTGHRSVTRSTVGLPTGGDDGLRFDLGPDHPISRCARSARPLLIGAVHDPELFDMWSPAQRQWGIEREVNSVLAAPVLAGGTVFAVLVFLSCGDRPRFDADDLVLVTELGRRASTSVETALRFQQSREVSLALQSAMLTEPPVFPGVELVARYHPAAAGLQIGGDWYDAFVLPGGELGIGVGDVAGHDLSAAATMGQLRSMLRGLAHDSDATPAEVLRRLDRVVNGLAVTRFTTLIYGRLRLTEDGVRFRWSNAGHPPPVLIDPDGTPRTLDCGVDLVLGVLPDADRRDHALDLPPGSTLLLFTDGLFERRHDPEDRALPMLLELVAAGAGLSLPRLCDHLVEGSTAGTDDDTVVLAVRVPARP